MAQTSYQTTAAESTQLLSPREAAILDLEKNWWRSPLPKEAQIREQFGLSTARYYQELNLLIDTPTALSYDPLLVKRLRRMRTQRHRERSAQRVRKA